MKCKKCEKTFPCKIDFNGKIKCLSSRKLCLDCSPYLKENKIREGVDYKCERCERVYNSTASKLKNRKYCNSCLVTLKRNKMKEDILNIVGNKCCVCGYNRCRGSLDFHHLDPNQKSFSLSSNFNIINILNNKLKNEVKKCVVLCRNCHAEFHDGLISESDFKIENIDETKFDDLLKKYSYVPTLRENKKYKFLQKIKKVFLCLKCGKKKNKKTSSDLCKKCFNTKPKTHNGRKVKDRPSLEQLKKEIKEFGFLQTGKKYNVSDNCIRKWIKTEERWQKEEEFKKM